jgi:hypothetical protein
MTHQKMLKAVLLHVVMSKIRPVAAVHQIGAIR